MTHLFTGNLFAEDNKSPKLFATKDFRGERTAKNFSVTFFQKILVTHHMWGIGYQCSPTEWGFGLKEERAETS
jgi:hypothetical protein